MPSGAGGAAWKGLHWRERRPNEALKCSKHARSESPLVHKCPRRCPHSRNTPLAPRLHLQRGFERRPMGTHAQSSTETAELRNSSNHAHLGKLAVAELTAAPTESCQWPKAKQRRVKCADAWSSSERDLRSRPSATSKQPPGPANPSHSPPPRTLQSDLELESALRAPAVADPPGPSKP